MDLNLKVFERHPYLTGGGILVGAIILFFVMGGGSALAGGGTQVSSGGSSGSDPAALQAAIAQQQLAYGAASQASAQNFQLSELAAQIGGQISLKQLDLTAANNSIAAQLQQSQAQIALASHQTDVSAALQQSQISASLTAQAQQLKETTDLAALSAAATMHLSDTAAAVSIFNTKSFTDLQSLITTSQADVAKSQIGANVQIAGINAQAQEYIANKQASASKSSGLFGFLGSLALAFL